MSKNQNTWDSEHAKSADEVYQAVAAGPYGERWVELAMLGSSDEEKRKLAKMFIATIERCQNAQENGQDTPELSALYMDCLLALPYIRINDEPVGSVVDDGNGMPAATRIANPDEVGKDTYNELFARETEEYLASLGL